MSSFFRRTLGIARDSPDVESYDLNHDHSIQEHSTSPIPHHDASLHSSSPVHSHHPYGHVRSYASPSNTISPGHSYAQVPHAAPGVPPHAPPSVASVKEVHSEGPRRDQLATLTQEQMLRREDRDGGTIPKPRLQRQSKSPRPVPFYEEPVSI